MFLTKINKIIQRKINLPKYHDSGRLRGYGHVIFKTKKGLTKVLYNFETSNNFLCPGFGKKLIAFRKSIHYSRGGKTNLAKH